MNARNLLVLATLAMLPAAAVSMSGSAFASEIEFLGIKPEAVFAKESTHVTVTTKPKEDLGPEDRLFLIEVEEDGRTKRIIGEMYDVGRWGDTVKNDGYYSKQFQVFDKKGDQKRHYTVVRQVGKEVPETLADRDPALVKQSDIVSVQIIRRPNALEVVSRVWGKLIGD